MIPIAHLWLQTVVKGERELPPPTILGLLHLERVEFNSAQLRLCPVEARFVLQLKRDTNCSSQAADSCQERELPAPTILPQLVLLAQLQLKPGLCLCEE